MTATTKEREGGSQQVHKRWLERRLEIEVGKVTAKLQSKGMAIPEQNAEALEAGACLAQTHLPKLCIDLHGRNPNGTIKVQPSPQRPGPPKPPSVVQKLDDAMDPTQLTPLPSDIAAMYGLPTSPHAIGGHSRASLHLPLQHLSPTTFKPGHQQTEPRGSSGGGAVSPTAYAARANCGSASDSADAGGGESSFPLSARSGLPASQFRPDLQGAEARIDEAMAEVQRVAMQANEMSPRARVLYLAKQANPDFELPNPASRMQRSATMAQSRLRRELTRRSTKRFLGFSAETSSTGGDSTNSRQQQQQQEPQQQPQQRQRLDGLQGANSVLRRSYAASRTKEVAASSNSLNFKPEGYLPPLPLPERSHSVDAGEASSRGGHAAAATESVGQTTADAGGAEALPRLGADLRRSSDANPADKPHAGRVPLPPLPQRHSPVDPLSSFSENAANAMVDLWEVAASAAAAAAATTAAVESPAAEAAAAAAAAEDAPLGGRENGSTAEGTATAAGRGGRSADLIDKDRSPEEVPGEAPAGGG